MRIQTLSTISLTCAMALWSSTALAEATDEGAAALLATLQTYLGTTEGVVAVAVDGDDYKVTLDVAPLMAKVPANAGLTATVSKIDMTVTDNGDGTWDYAVDQPATIAYEVPGTMKTSTEYGQILLTGTFNEELGDSSEYHLEMNDLVTDQTQTDPTMGEMSIKMTQDSMVMDGTAEAGEAGVNSKFTTTVSGLAYDLTMPGGEGMPPMTFNATVAEGSATGGLTGYQPAGLYGLLAFFVAHPDAALIEADKPGLKTALEAAMPLFANLQMTGAYKDIAVTTPMGPVGLAEMGVTIDANGLVEDGKFREAFSLKGLTLPEGVLPPFAAPLLPSDLAIDVTASRFNPAAAVGLGLGLLDLPAGGTPPADFDAQMMAAIMPEGVVDITLAPGETNAPAYRLTYEGAMTAGPAMPMPTGKARIGLTGIDAIGEALKASPPEMGMAEMAPMLEMAKMLAQPGVDGELIWEIEATDAGGLLVNGQDMMGAGQ
jgi:hypothetical protein